MRELSGEGCYEDNLVGLKPRCLMNHHGDDGNLIEYMGEGKPCRGCQKRQECFDIFYAYKRQNKEGEWMTYRPGGGGESRRTISSVAADIRANEREKMLELLNKLSGQFLQDYNNSRTSIYPREYLEGKSDALDIAIQEIEGMGE